MAGNVRPTVKLHTSRAQQDIKNRNLKQNLPSTAHEPYMDICGEVMISTPKKLMEK